MKRQKVTLFAHLVTTAPTEEHYSDSEESGEEDTLPLDRNDVFVKRKNTKRDRKRSKRPGILQERETNVNIVKDGLNVNCCQMSCLKKVDVTAAKKCRDSFYSKTQDEQSNFIERNIRCSDANKDDKHLTFVCFGARVCDKAWQIIYGIKKRRYYYILKKCRSTDEDLDNTDKRTSCQYSSRQFLEARSYVNKFSKNHGDDQPDVEETHLPSCLSILQVWKEYVASCESQGLLYLSYQRFHSMWTQEFQHVKIPKYQKLSKCNYCVNFKEAFSLKLTKIEMEDLQAQKKCHLLLQEICREKYYKHIKKSRENPAAYVSLIIDNMDQAKTNLPRFPLHFKNETSLSKMHHHVTGVLSHGLKKAYTFTWTDQFPSDCNITLNCLMLALNDAAEENGGHLPPTLYIQADNSPKDNKNKYVIMFLAMLVKAEIVKKIKLTFLMVGHTHEDVDQLFSRISSKANLERIPTLPSLLNLIKRSFTPTPVVKHLESLWYFREQMVVPAQLSGIMSKHVFRLTKTNDQVLLSMKEWPLSTSSYETIDLSPVIPDIANALTVKPNVEKITPLIKTMKDDIPKWCSNGKLTTEDQLWWDQYLTKLERRDRSQPATPQPSAFRKYKAPQPLNAELHVNLANALQSHMNAITRKTTAKLVVRRPRV